MMPVETWLYFLVGLMIVASMITLEMKDVLAAIVATGIVGLILSLVFLILQAPDLALVQFIYEILILSVVIIIMTYDGKKPHLTELKRDPYISTMTVLGLLPLLTVGFFALRGLPAFGEPLVRVAAHYISQGAQETGAVNLVTAIIMDYRVIDTLGEATVIFTGILGALTIIRKTGRVR